MHWNGRSTSWVRNHETKTRRVTAERLSVAGHRHGHILGGTKTHFAAHLRIFSAYVRNSRILQIKETSSWFDFLREPYIYIYMYHTQTRTLKHLCVQQMHIKHMYTRLRIFIYMNISIYEYVYMYTYTNYIYILYIYMYVYIYTSWRSRALPVYVHKRNT